MQPETSGRVWRCALINICVPANNQFHGDCCYGLVFPSLTVPAFQTCVSCVSSPESQIHASLRSLSLHSPTAILRFLPTCTISPKYMRREEILSNHPPARAVVPNKSFPDPALPPPPKKKASGTSNGAPRSTRPSARRSTSGPPSACSTCVRCTVASTPSSGNTSRP